MKRMAPVYFFALFSLLAASNLQLVHAQSRSKKEPVLDREYESEKFAFKAYFSEKPKVLTERFKTKAGDILITNVSHTLKDVTYAVIVFDYPESVKNADPQKLIDSAKDALCKDGKLIKKDDKINFTGPSDKQYPALDITVDFEKNQVRTRLGIIDGTLYQVSVSGTEKAISADLPKKFIASFEITK